MPIKQPPKPKFNTLTTAGRVAKAAYERAAMAEKAKTPENTTPPPQTTEQPTAPKKKRKMQILPPPHELAAEAELKGLEKKAKAGSKKKAPLTTKEKIAANAATQARERKRKQPVDHDGIGLKVVEGGIWSQAGSDGGDGKKSSKGKKKAAAEKPKNLMDFMRDFQQVPAAAAVVPTARSMGKKAKVARESVLVRPTERTKRLRADMYHLVSIKDEHENVNDASSGSRLMTLPLEVRQRIWRLVIVETQFFVYPAISAEQPDLAMTSREIRGEVLPLYYGENTFALEAPVKMGREITSGRVSLEPAIKWAAALGGGGHTGTIGKWALSLVLPTGGVADAEVRDPKSNREALVSLQYPKSGSMKHAQPEVEIHRKGSCLLPSHEEYRQCVRTCHPRWVDDALAAAFLSEKHDRGKQVILFAGSIEKKGHELVGSQCVDAGEVVVVEDD